MMHDEVVRPVEEVVTPPSPSTALDDVLAHAVVDNVCDVKQPLSNGGGTLTELQAIKRRLELYSEIHANEEEMLKAVKEFATDEPLQKKLHTISDDTDEEEEAPTIATRHSDIWGKVPPKEPKRAAKCTVCEREILALRFAPHLDKCMNLGTVRMAAANNTAVSSVRGTPK
jgi:hypothetical protein